MRSKHSVRKSQTEQISNALPSALPAAVRDGLQKKAGAGKITKHGKIVPYETKILTAGKKCEVQVGPDGKPLAHEE